MVTVHKASCLCGAIRVEVRGDLGEVDACHCTQCRKQSGHYWASTDVARENVSIAGEENLTWYQSSERVRRGFCRSCGSILFWDASKRAKLGIAMGVFEKPTGARLAKHIFVADKGDYYEIADGLEQDAS